MIRLKKNVLSQSSHAHSFFFACTLVLKWQSYFFPPHLRFFYFLFIYFYFLSKISDLFKNMIYQNAKYPQPVLSSFPRHTDKLYGKTVISTYSLKKKCIPHLFLKPWKALRQSIFFFYSLTFYFEIPFESGKANAPLACGQYILPVWVILTSFKCSLKYLSP